MAADETADWWAAAGESDHDRAKRFLELGQDEESDGNRETAAAIYAEAAAAYARDRDESSLAEALLRRAGALRGDGAVDPRATAAVVAAIAAAQASGNRLIEAVALRTRSLLLTDADRHEEALDWAKRSVEVIRSYGVESELAASLDVEAECKFSLGRFDDALATAELALAAYRESGDLEGAVGADDLIARVLMQLDRCEEAVTAARRGARVAGVLRNDVLLAQAQRRLGRALSRTGDPEAAIECYGEARRLYLAVGNLREVAVCDVTTAWAVEDNDEAEEMMLSAMEVFDILGDDPQRLDVRRGLLPLLWWDEERKDYLRVAEPLPQIPGFSGAGEDAFLVCMTVHVAVAQERVDWAEEFLRGCFPEPAAGPVAAACRAWIDWNTDRQQEAAHAARMLLAEAAFDGLLAEAWLHEICGVAADDRLESAAHLARALAHYGGHLESRRQAAVAALVLEVTAGLGGPAPTS